MEKHIATYTIESQGLQQTISLLYEIYLHTGQFPTIIITDKYTCRWNKALAHQLATNAISEHAYAEACKM